MNWSKDLLTLSHILSKALSMSVKCIVRDFLSSTALYLLRNDIEGHKKEAYIRPICFIREL